MLPEKVIDFHAHFPAAQDPPGRNLHPLILAYSRQLRERWRQDYGFPEPEKEHPGNDKQAERWAAEVRRNGLEKIVFMTGGNNETLAAIVHRYPDYFCGFAHHNLCEPDAVDNLVYALDELGLSGYKWFGPLTDIPFESPELKPFWSVLAERRAPVLIHFGVLGGPGGTVWHPRISPLSLAPVAQAYPEIPFVIPHFGSGYFQDLLHLAWSSPNIYIDTSGSNDWMRWCPYPLTLKDLFAKALDTVGPERIVFGTDSSWFPRGWAKIYCEQQVAACHELGLAKEEINLIFYENAKRLLKL
ncbi:MAG: amidohydrolase family protein [Firmicutes bacterium]|nr:amidohydrolase family protein [Bacillota bacterium]